MVGKPIPQKPTSSPGSPQPLSSGDGKTIRVESSPLAPHNRNSPSDSTVTSMSDLANSGHPQKPARRKNNAELMPTERLVSLDAFRGFIMMMLAVSGFGLLSFSRIDETSPVWQIHDRSLWQRIGFHFDHPAWISSFDYFKVSFWDLIQPAFMFMVGAAMPFSGMRRASQGHGLLRRTCHAFLRSVILVLMGVFLYSMGHDRTNWIFPNVLCQIGLGYFFAWILHHWRVPFQIGALVLILAGYWAWFFMSPPPAGYDYASVNASREKGEVLDGKFAAWSKNANAAFLFDGWLLPTLRSVPEPESPEVSADPEPSQPAESALKEPEKPAWFRQWFLSNTEPYEFNSGGYTTLNFIPSIGTTLLGILCGQLLLQSSWSKWKKLGLLIGAAAICLGLGIAADQTICPVVKRIWTPSWVLFSGGYVIGMLALFYLLFDIAPLRVLAFPLVVVGTNSILIYMLGQTISGWMRENVVKVHLSGMIENIFGPKALDSQWYGVITFPTTVFILYWLFLLWLYRQRIFLRI